MTHIDDGTETTANTPAAQASYDVAVVGGGAAGLSGALALARSRRSVVVIDDDRPRNAPAAHLHNYLSRDGTPPRELLAIGRDEVMGYGGTIVAGSVSAVQRLEAQDERPGFRLSLSDGGSIRARRLLVAVGVRDELPDLPGIAERWGRDVLHCPYCHGWEVRDQAIGILATGPMAAHQAQMFRQLSSDVVVFQHTAPAFTDEQLEQFAAREIDVVEGEVAALEINDDRLVGLRLRSGMLVPRQAVVVAPVSAPRAGLLDSIGLETSTRELGGHVVAKYVAADATGATAVPGVWVAGNVADPTAQLVSSAAAGLMAGAVINADLIAEETARAVAAARERNQG